MNSDEHMLNAHNKMCVITTIEGTMNSFIIPAMERFVEEGYDVTLVCSMSDEFIKTNSKKFTCINIPMRRGISLVDIIKMPFKFLRLFRKEKFDYVQYATTNASFYAGIPAKLCGIKTRVYCQWGLLYVGYSGFKRYVFKLIETILCLTATHVTVASKKNLEYAVKDRIMPASKASVIGDGGTIGVDFSVFNVKKRDVFRNQVLSEYPQLKGKLVYGYVGRIESDKGIGELLNAFLSLNDDNSALLLVGAFDHLRCHIDPNLLELAKSSGNVIFHGFSREVPKYMSAMDVLVHPTYREGFSMVIQQAMAMECTIITTDVPGPSEVVEEGISGILVKDHSIEDLVRVMSLVASDVELRNRLSSSALQRVREKFNRQRMLELTYQDRLRMMND